MVQTHSRTPGVETLADRFKGGPPKRLPADTRSPLTGDERAYILFCHLRRIPLARIAREIGVGRSTVSTAVHDLWRCPSLLLLMDLYALIPKSITSGNRQRTGWVCRICGMSGSGKSTSALRHILIDIFPWFRGFDPSRFNLNAIDVFRARLREERELRAWERETGAS